MRHEVRALGDLGHADCCVIGTGPAGITCARALAAKGHRVVLLEAGGEQRSEQSQAVYRGRVEGDRYFALDATRLRHFGGTSNHWAGWCRWLDPHDFEAKAGLAHTAWPIGKDALDPYLAEAREILDISPIGPDEPIGDSGLKIVHFAFSPPTRFAQKYGAELRRHPRIALVLDADVTHLEADGDRITGAAVRAPDGTRHRVTADSYVLATGGLENSRLLLWSNRVTGGRVVPQPATLGRYWMEHPHVRLGRGLVAADWLPGGRACRSPILALTRATLRETGVLNCGLRLPLQSDEATRATLDALAGAAPELARRYRARHAAGTLCGVRVEAAFEQEPRADNRVRLSERETDRRGVPRLVLHWRHSELDRRTARATAGHAAHVLATRGLGRIRLDPWLLGDGRWPTDGALAGHHHMGGTRMAARPADGVVDGDGRVFGRPNLFVAGSSVFPSGGHANPTLTIVQLALRLADRIHRGA
jgi:choline dehydrogenase-like flavoprotein